ncbi:hypothetical protein [Rhodococcus rhodochrous]|uniref:hypothetical protein n=1 Tax=Rhodococcus rhodochrous TaxID=1829 RepID=UPI00036E177D|nr:hypothetical protein [Rhodococcus rhodochrous]
MTVHDKQTATESTVEKLKETDALKPSSLMFAVLASVVCTVITPAFGAGRFGTLAAAAAGPVVAAIITTHGRGPVRIAGISGLALVALLITVTGFTVTEAASGGRSLTADRQGTFVDTDKLGNSGLTGSTSRAGTGGVTTIGPDIQVPSGVTCEPTEDAFVCASIEVHSVGTEYLEVTGLEVEGSNVADFGYTDDCVGYSHAPGTSCVLDVAIYPASTDSDLSAVLVVHQNLPGPPSYVTLSGASRCSAGSSSNTEGCGGGTSSDVSVLPTTPGPPTLIPSGSIEVPTVPPITRDLESGP